VATKVIDLYGVEWWVYRKWSHDVKTVRHVLVEWPFWFMAHWLGLAWLILIECDGKIEGKEKVRGWGKSGQRIQEIAESVAAGTWQ
jgi:hypothetical protein